MDLFIVNYTQTFSIKFCCDAREKSSIKRYKKYYIRLRSLSFVVRKNYMQKYLSHSFANTMLLLATDTPHY